MLVVEGKEYDFLDFGASKGGCIDFALKRLGGRSGLGVDIDAAKVEQLRQIGYDCIQGDVTALDLPRNCVRFVTISHVLEHLPDLDSVRKALKTALWAASDFIFIQGPFFDADEYLSGLGLKFFWSDWKGHRCHLKSWDLCRILTEIGPHKAWLMARLPVEDSSNPSIHPLDSPQDQFDYDKRIHPPKPCTHFKLGIFRELVCWVQIGGQLDRRMLLKARPGCCPLALDASEL